MPMFYIHQSSCISPQQTFGDVDIQLLHSPKDQQLKIIEPSYTGIPPGVLRRMNKAVRMGMGAALPLLHQQPAANGIVIGTANAGMEDCFYFLKQMVEYDEGLLTPGSFVQSTPNALAAQLAMLSHNNGYNITHVHLGLAFENAMTDIGMLLNENPANQYLLGAVDDISSYNYALNVLAGWNKKETAVAEEWFAAGSPGSIAGEGTAMFVVNRDPLNAVAKVRAIHTVHSTDIALAQQQLKEFLNKQLIEREKVDVLLSGENGDERFLKCYNAYEAEVPGDAAIFRFKQMCGEYPTATAFALWLACYMLEQKPIPSHMLKRPSGEREYKNILICNNHRGSQHSFILVSAPGDLPVA